MNYLCCGGAGFIGSHFIEYLLNKEPDCKVLCLDKLTYAGNKKNLDFKKDPDRYFFIEADICKPEMWESEVNTILDGNYTIVNFAAETHVDNSIKSANEFIKSNFFGVANLLELAKDYGLRMVQISTDEVYGSSEDIYFTEEDRLNPSSPYSATKAGGELLALSYYKTHGVDVVITRSSNNYGERQHPEKFIPTCILSALKDKPIPIYGDGKQSRDWIYVKDNCKAIYKVMKEGQSGEIYNISSMDLIENIVVAKRILHKIDRYDYLIRNIGDRPAHDFSYRVSNEKIKGFLNWEPETDFSEGMDKTIQWYKDNA